MGQGLGLRESTHAGRAQRHFRAACKHCIDIAILDQAHCEANCMRGGRAGGRNRQIRAGQVDDRAVGEGHRGPVTKELQSAFFTATKGEDPRYPDWLTYVRG